MSSPEYSNETQEEDVVERQFCLAEVSAVLLVTLGVLILISGAGFFTVDPPGEQDLCQIKTLGLQNKTKGDQDLALGTCHALYSGVFNMLHVIAIPFLLCGLLAIISGVLVTRGVCARLESDTPGLWKTGIFFNIGGLVMVAVPSMIFPSVTAVVSAGLAPIHAYFITIMAAHFAVEVSGAASNGSEGDPGVKEAAQTYETLYLGYCAASRTELCLFVGSTCMMILVGTYIFDTMRSVAALTCTKPDYTAPGGCEMCKVWRRGKKAKDGLYNKVDDNH
jgi:hypothetical protein